MSNVSIKDCEPFPDCSPAIRSEMPFSSAASVSVFVVAACGLIAFALGVAIVFYERRQQRKSPDLSAPPVKVSALSEGRLRVIAGGLSGMHYPDAA